MGEDWTIAAFDHPLDVEWDREGDEWLDHLGDALRELPDSGSWQAGFRAEDAGDGVFFEVAAEMQHLNSNLRLVNEAEGVWALIVGSGTDRESQVKTWRKLLEVANDRLGANHQDFAWLALIGPAAGSGYNVPLPAGDDIRCGPLQLIPKDSSFWEYR